LSAATVYCVNPVSWALWQVCGEKCARSDNWFWQFTARWQSS